MKYLLTILAIALLGTPHLTQGQQADNFNQAKLHLANHKLNQAIPILEGLWNSDPKNANLNLSFIFSYTNCGTSTTKAKTSFKHVIIIFIYYLT